MAGPITTLHAQGELFASDTSDNSAAPRSPADVYAATGAADAVRILLVDDDPDCRGLIREAIADCRIANEIVEQPSGIAALKYLQRISDTPGGKLPALIYLDIEMPGIDGIETLRLLRADPRLKEIPVVIMTGVADEAQMRAAATYGANSYTLKPSNGEQFLRTVLASTTYWLTIHQRPSRHWPPELCRR